jgi:hypothetical protein
VFCMLIVRKCPWEPSEKQPGCHETVMALRYEVV